MRPGPAWRIPASLMSAVLMAACGTGTTTPTLSSSAASLPGSTSSAAPTQSTDEPTFEVKEQGPDGPEIKVFIFDATGSVTAARAATQADERPFIESEVEPRIGAVPGVPNDLRVFWAGGGCDISYRVGLTTNPDGALHVEVRQGPMSSPSCDSLGIGRGVVLTFKAPIDATTVTGEFHSALP